MCNILQFTQNSLIVLIPYMLTYTLCDDTIIIARTHIIQVWYAVLVFKFTYLVDDTSLPIGASTRVSA